VRIQVAGLTIQVDAAPGALEGLEVAPGRASVPFVVRRGAPDVRIDVSARDLARQNGGDDAARACLFDSGGAWRLYRHDEGFLFRIFSSTLAGVPYKIAVFSDDFTRGRIVLHRPFFTEGVPVDPLEYPLDELLVVSLLARGRGVEVHACGVADGDAAGYLFVGQSGAGKSTMARLWLAERDAVILSDDRVVLRAGDAGVWMYGTPWHGEEPLAAPRRARLDRVFFLRDHDRHEIAPVRRADAVARLFAASFLPFYDAAAVGFTLQFLDAMVARVRAYDLRFIPASTVIDIVRRHDRRVR
jgi:hypothetical protein